MDYVTIRTIFLLCIVVSFFGLLVWIFRPHSKQKYDAYSKIPLNNSEDEDSEKERQ